MGTFSALRDDLRFMGGCDLVLGWPPRPFMLSLLFRAILASCEAALFDERSLPSEESEKYVSIRWSGDRKDFSPFREDRE